MTAPSPDPELMTAMARLARDWDDASTEAMYWSIIGERVTTPVEAAAFFAGGRREVGALLSRAGELGYPRQRRRALDFGCGVGRLTCALAEEFEDVVGLDIAPRMIAEAEVLGERYTNCRFDVIRTPDLRDCESATFDLVLSHLVLQHLTSEALILRFVSELVRVVGPGGIVILQLPSSMRLWQRLQPRRRVYTVLRNAGLGPGPLFGVGLQPIRMRSVASHTVTRTLADAGATVLAVDAVTWPAGIESSTYFVTR
jgi:2-polyprenyl-3-methyl-5-hydroxy-6-metoxy-1,4-benzoquinol methylase